MYITHFSSTFCTKQLQCMLISYTIGIANGHKYGSLYVFCIPRPIIWLQVYTDNLLYKFREAARIVSKTIVLFLYGCAFKHICGEGSIHGLYIGPPTVMRIRTR